MPEYTDDPTYGDTGGLANQDQTEDLTSGLPPYLPRARDTGNWNLMYPVGVAVNNAEHDVESVDFAQNVQDAETVEQLQKIGEFISVPLNEGETKEHYRARLLARGMLATSEGTIEDVLVAAQEILDTDMSNFTYEEPARGSTENGTASLEMPGEALDNTALTASEVATILEAVIQVGCRIEGLVSGTFTYITPTDYNNNNHDATKGYDGLDANGDPKNNGGTYAGLI